MLRKDVTFINRQKGSGTRFIFDSYLAKNGIEPARLNGYDNEEWTHLAVATAVSRGAADAGFGIRTAASQLDLDFLPVTKEQFDLVFRWTDQNKEALEALIQLIQSEAFIESAEDMDGYDFSELGSIIFDRH